MVGVEVVAEVVVGIEVAEVVVVLLPPVLPLSDLFSPVRCPSFFEEAHSLIR